MHPAVGRSVALVSLQCCTQVQALTQRLSGQLAGFCSSQIGHRVACLDQSRGSIRLSGGSVIHFLQGLVTNDVRGLEQPGAEPLYAAFLTPKGRFLYDAFLYSAVESTPTVVLDVDASSKPSLIQWLQRYRLRQKIEIQDVSGEYSTWVQFGGAPCQPASGWHTDPRLPELGLRTILPQGQQPSVDGAHSATADDYTRWRILQGVAEGSTEIPSDKAHPLEFNLDGLRGVSYTKGCYIGQEKQSFTHYRGVIRKRCMPARLQPAAAGAAKVGDEVIAESGEVVGTVRAAAGDVVLVHVRLQQALQAASGELKLLLQGQDVSVMPWVPSWWPSEYTSPQAQQ